MSAGLSDFDYVLRISSDKPICKRANLLIIAEVLDFRHEAGYIISVFVF